MRKKERVKPMLDLGVSGKFSTIDLIIGLEYVDFYENKYNAEFFINLYIEHKRAFNNLSERIWNKTWNPRLLL